MPDASFARKLDTVLKALSMSRGRLAQEAGLDKSLVGRWVAGTVNPSSHNLEKVTAAIARRHPGFSMLDWDRPLSALAERLGGAVEEPVLPAPGMPSDALAFPFDITGVARKETARRGDEYCGFYWNYRYSFSRPGYVGRIALMIHPKDGILEVRKGAPGFEHRGPCLLLLNRLYMMLAEEKFEAMAFLITNAGQQPKARCMSGIMTSVATAGLLMPKSTRCLMVRDGDLSGDSVADHATYQTMKAVAGVFDPSGIPADILPHITRNYGPDEGAEGDGDMLRAPFVDLPG